MWMIANRLGGFDIETRLNPNMSPVLNSALPVYIPGCVRISASGNDVLCEYEKDYIRIRDLSLGDGYMLIQGIFDWYQDWMDRMDQAVMNGRFQKVALECSRGFGNPVMLQDSNYRLLGMEGEFADGDMPPEWRYIRQNGQSSVEGYTFMAQTLTRAAGRYGQNIRQFEGRKNSLIPYGGLHAKIAFQGREFGKLTVLEYNRTMNRGDIDLLIYLARRMSIYNAAISGISKKYLDDQTMEAMIAGQPVEPEKVAYFQSIMENGKDGQFAVMTVQFADPGRAGDQSALLLLKNLIADQYTESALCICQDAVVALLFSPTPIALARQTFQSMGLLGYRDQLRVGVSLPFDSLSETGAFYRQSLVALRSEVGAGLTEFYGLAVRQMLEADRGERLLCCEPTLRRLWEREPEKRDALRSLGAYLDAERSCTLAAQRLYVHKNTLTYRIHSLKEETGWNLDDAYQRNYLRLSLYALEARESAAE